MRRVALALGLGLGLSGAVGIPPANAGTYVMRNCNVPGHGNSLFHPWRPSYTQSPELAAVDRCASGGGFAVTVGDSRQIAGGSGMTVSLQKPTEDRSDVRFVKLMIWYAARLAGSGQPLMFVTGDVRGEIDHSHHPGLSTSPPGSENLIAEQALSPETRSVQMSLRCGVFEMTTPDPCIAAHRVPLLIRGIEVTLREDVPPIVLPPTGTLLDEGAQGGIRTVAVSASDAQSGLKKVEVLLGETAVATHDLMPRCPHSDFTVCPASEDATLQIDTRAVANGSHRLTVRAVDAAGNESLVRGDGPVEVANAPAAAAPIDTPAYALSARLKGTSRTTLTVPFGRRMSLSGSLTHGAEAVAPGTTVEILERLDRRGAREVRRARVKTRANGRFSAALSTRRPSRRIRLAYRPAGGDRIVSRTLRLRVRAASSVRASLRGRVMHFSGTVRSGPIPKGGKRLVMEGRSPGSAWTPFRSLRTNAKGRFSGTYRLRVHRPGVRLSVRALVRSEGGYGYLSSRSRAVTLRVR